MGVMSRNSIPSVGKSGMSLTYSFKFMASARWLPDGWMPGPLRSQTSSLVQHPT